jgi:hypothetical protein
VNADITLPPTWWKAIQHVLPILLVSERPFLIAGPRLVLPEGVVWHPTKVVLKRGFLFSCFYFFFLKESWMVFEKEWIIPKKYSLPVIDGAIDWFVFRKGSYDHIPPFKLGRYVWDSWMVDFATRSNWNSVTTFSYDRGDQIAFGLHTEVRKKKMDYRLFLKKRLAAFACSSGCEAKRRR